MMHVLQNGTRWLLFITVKSNIFLSPNDSEPCFGTSGDAVSASEHTTGITGLYERLCMLTSVKWLLTSH